MMAETVSAVSTPKASRLDRRKAQTRQALIDAAVRLIAGVESAVVITQQRARPVPIGSQNTNIDT
jgi:hypothetical protein